MSPRTIFIAAVLIALPCGVAQAQTWEASAWVGYTPSADLNRRAPELNQLDERGGFTWGVEGSRFISPHWGVEAAWIEQKSALEIGTADAGAVDLFTMTIRQLQGHVIYEFNGRDAQLRPFAFGGVGATFFHASNLQSETKLSFDFGAGLKYFVWRDIGVLGQIRYKPTWLKDESSGDFCDPFGFCQSWLRQIELAAGIVVRF